MSRGLIGSLGVWGVCIVHKMYHGGGKIMNIVQEINKTIKLCIQPAPRIPIIH
jgi:hypothetical protein